MTTTDAGILAESDEHSLTISPGAGAQYPAMPLQGGYPIRLDGLDTPRRSRWRTEPGPLSAARPALSGISRNARGREGNRADSGR